MSDTVELQIDQKRIGQWESYNIEADIYQAADSFSLTMANPALAVKPGSRCKLSINGRLELTGIIDAVTKSYDKTGAALTVSGRDLMGLLVDSHCEKFITVQGWTVRRLAEMLIKTVPFIQTSDIVYQENVVGKLKGKKQSVAQPAVGFMDIPQKFSQIEPGMTIFEVLGVYAASRGLMFFNLPDGTFVFGKPKQSGEALFRITHRADGRGNNVESGEMTDDISQKYSKITVVSQSQGTNADGGETAAINTSHSAVNPDAPFYKPLVTQVNNDSQTPKMYARMLLEKQRHEGFSLTYTLPAHSQNGRNWAINELCEVEDERFGIKKPMLIFNRKFRRDKRGSFTEIKLGPPGLVMAST